MSHLVPFQIQEFKNYCDDLKRVGIDPGYVMYTNHYASNELPAARFFHTDQLALAQAHIATPTEDTFKGLVACGVLFDTEWDYKTRHWHIISFEGWECLHKAFSHLYAKSNEALNS